jgi:hypothetical protein
MDFWTGRKEGKGKERNEEGREGKSELTRGFLVSQI